MKKWIYLTVATCSACAAAWVGCGGSTGTGGSGTAATGHGAAATVSSGKGGATSTKASASSSSSGVTTGLGGMGGAGAGAGGAGGGTVVGITCNPVTNAGCMSTDTCDIAVDPNSGMITGFQCYPPPNTATVCTTCNPGAMNGPFCATGLTCLPLDMAGMVLDCARYCCTDADCGPGGKCNVAAMFFAPATTTLGFCIAGPSAGTGGSGTGGSSGMDGGTDGGTGTGTGGSGVDGGTGTGTGGAGAGGGGTNISLACNPPATAPSNGSCVTVM